MSKECKVFISARNIIKVHLLVYTHVDLKGQLLGLFLYTLSAKSLLMTMPLSFQVVINADSGMWFQNLPHSC